MRKFSLVASALAVAGLAGVMLTPTSPAQAADQLVVTAGGGSFQDALRKVVFAPFSKATGIKVTDAEYDYGTAKIRAMVKTNTVSWAVVYASQARVQQMCDESIIEPLDWKKLETLGLDRTKFEDVAFTECGVPAANSSTFVAYDKNQLPNGPKTIGDFFDLKKFPGKRGLYKDAGGGSLEWALIADGVATKDVYKVLDTPEGIDRAFKKLDTIKKDVIWWTSGGQPIQLLADRQVLMTLVWSSPGYDAIKSSGNRFGMMWDAARVNDTAWVLPKGGPSLLEAYKFLAFAGSASVQAALSNETGIGPLNKDASALVDSAVQPYLPNSYVGSTFQFDSRFWAAKGDELRQRFNVWLAQ